MIAEFFTTWLTQNSELPICAWTVLLAILNQGVDLIVIFVNSANFVAKYTRYRMTQEELDRSTSPSELKMSTKASAFSIAAIIGEQPLKRASDNISPSGMYMFSYSFHINATYFTICNYY